ncbi:MAG TPA: hypothetical protein VF933_19265, partial [Streptosporangiaceae bacterium]
FGRISGGHRHATHSFLGIAVFTALAWLSCHFRADWGGRYWPSRPCSARRRNSAAAVQESEAAPVYVRRN